MNEDSMFFEDIPVDLPVKYIKYTDKNKWYKVNGAPGVSTDILADQKYQYLINIGAYSETDPWIKGTQWDEVDADWLPDWQKEDSPEQQIIALKQQLIELDNEYLTQRTVAEAQLGDEIALSRIQKHKDLADLLRKQIQDLEARINS